MSTAADIHSLYETPTSCRDEWAKYIQSTPKRVVVRDATFLTTTTSTNHDLLAACASDGNVYLWKVPTAEQLTASQQEDVMDNYEATLAQTGMEDYRQPVAICRIQTGALTTIRSHLHNNKRLLLVGGEDGLYVMDWEEVWSKLSACTTPCSLGDLNLSTSAAHNQPYPTPNSNYSGPVNDALIHGDHVYAAVGDAFGLYQWHLETRQLVKTYSNTAYLQSLEILPAGANGANLLLTGGDEGIVSLWDCQQNALIQELPLKNSTTRPSRRGDERKSISSLAVLDDNWFTVAGGIESNHSHQGFLATYSVPTRTIVSSTETWSRPQRCAYLSNRTLALAANEPVVSYRYATDLNKTTGKTCCSSPSVHVVAVALDGRIALGGVGRTIDLFDSWGQEQLFQFIIS